MRFDMQGLRRLVKASRWRFGVAVLVALLCGLVIGAVLPWHGAVSKAVGKDTPTPVALPDPVHLSSAFASIVATVEPAVVNISTRKSTGQRISRACRADFKTRSAISGTASSIIQTQDPWQNTAWVPGRTFLG